jgi:hypothetical protein
VNLIFPKLQWCQMVHEQTQIPCAQRVAIVVIGLTADKYGCRAWKSTESVAAATGLDPRTIQRARKAAVDAGFWRVMLQPRRGKTTEYQLLVPKRIGETAVSPQLEAVG